MTATDVVAVDREQLLDSIAEYADRLAKADRLADADSLAKAADLNALYVDGSWVAEWQEVHPARKDATGRVDSGSRSRFAAWLTWAEEQRGKSAPVSRRCYQLLTAHEIVSLLPPSRLNTVQTEGTVRPLLWLLKAKYADRIPEVWARAVELADGKPVTNKHVLEARREFRAELSPSQNRAAIQTQRAHTHRLKAQSAVETLFGDHDDTEAQAFHDWYVAYIKRLGAS